MSKYCKAYSVKDLSQFAGWNEHYPRTKTERQEDGQEIKVTVELSDDDYLYLHDNYVVTDGIFEDKNVIFNKVTDEWIVFCKEKLNFQIPDYSDSKAKNY